MQFMVIERFKNQEARAVHARFRNWQDLVHFEIIPVVQSSSAWKHFS
ncbi:hypothetical protein BH10CYA1_BH10CYA1_27500 [soil metagenome]